MISFIVPAHNEARWLGATLESIGKSASGLSERFEIIVVDDDSTDDTAGIARRGGAVLVQVQYRQIAAVRNAGARAAQGNRFFFVDADTLANPAAVRAGLAAMDAGAVGGGCFFRFDGKLPFWARVIYPPAAMLGCALKLAGGCFLFCKRDAFEAVGGFDERLFASEELTFLAALKRRGRVVVPRPRVVTSGRKIRGLTAAMGFGLLFHWLRNGEASLWSRVGLDVWYAELRDDPDLPNVAHSGRSSP